MGTIDRYLGEERRRIQPRAYQLKIAQAAQSGNTLVILPTGLGKTLIAALVAEDRVKKLGGKCLVLAPTRPLCEQHRESFTEFLGLTVEETAVLTGELSPQTRAEYWRRARYIFATPQTVKNDIIAGRARLSEVVLLVFDEAHRAVGNYPYGFIAEAYVREAPHARILGLTASPGYEESKVKEICKALFIEHIEARDEKSPDVRPYVQPVRVVWEKVKLPAIFQAIKRNLLDLARERVEKLRQIGFQVEWKSGGPSKKDMLELLKGLEREEVKFQLSRDEYLEARRAVLHVIAALHALELLETQGLHALREYLEKVRERARRGGYTRLLVVEEKWRRVEELCNRGIAEGVEHPKLEFLRREVSRQLTIQPRSRILVFTHYRATASMLVEELSKIPGVKVAKLIGQTKREGEKGLKQREQVMILEALRRGEVNTLIATQVAEEGLDVAECQLVVFYDNVPSAIRFIQRRGRTGRIKPGRVVVLIAEGTRDEGFYWAAVRKRRKMEEVIRRISRSLKPSEQPLDKVLAQKEQKPVERVKVVVDSRELASETLRELSRMDVQLEIRSLKVADYVVSESVAIERKSVQDFAASIIDKRLFEQIRDLKASYESPILLIEGEGDYRGLTPEAFYGALASVVIDFGVPVLWAKTPREAAAVIYSIARREQREKRKEPVIKDRKLPASLKELQEYVVASLPGVDSVLAKRLLEAFGSIREVFLASEEKLQRVEGIGPKTAKNIRWIIDSPYRRAPESS